MTNHKRVSLLVFFSIISAIALSSFSVGTHGQERTAGQNASTSSDAEARRIALYKQFPTARYETTGEKDLARAEERRAKNSRYDDKGGLVDAQIPIEDGEERLLITEGGFETLPGIPASSSDLIVSGRIIDSKAFLSNNKKGVYSEFAVEIDEVFATRGFDVRTGTRIFVDREGGYVQYGNGKKRLHRIGGLGMPQVGRKYLLFLRNVEKTPNFEILSGVDLDSPSVVSINSGPNFKQYLGLGPTAFLNLVREAVADAGKVREVEKP